MARDHTASHLRCHAPARRTWAPNTKTRTTTTKQEAWRWLQTTYSLWTKSYTWWLYFSPSLYQHDIQRVRNNYTSDKCVADPPSRSPQQRPQKRTLVPNDLIQPTRAQSAPRAETNSSARDQLRCFDSEGSAEVGCAAVHAQPPTAATNANSEIALLLIIPQCGCRGHVQCANAKVPSQTIHSCMQAIIMKLRMARKGKQNQLVWLPCTLLSCPTRRFIHVHMIPIHTK